MHKRATHHCRSSSAPSPACGSCSVSSGWEPGGQWPCPGGQADKESGGEAGDFIAGTEKTLAEV